jgi:hypothetical protein
MSTFIYNIDIYLLHSNSALASLCCMFALLSMFVDSKSESLGVGWAASVLNFIRALHVCAVEVWEEG